MAYARYCNEVACIRKVFEPYIYCDKHQDKASTPLLPYAVDANIWAARLQEVGAKQVIYELRQLVPDKLIHEFFNLINFYPDPDSWEV